MSLSSLLLLLAALGNENDRKASLSALQERVEGTSVSVFKEAKLVSKPVFRYSDELREIEDAGIWLWTSGNRPIAAMKVERYKEDPKRNPWLYCFTSLSSDRVHAEWPDAEPFQARKPGITWQALDDKPSGTRAARLLQLRELARRFSAEILRDPEGKERAQMRMLTQPLYRYEESADVLDGAIFGFTGTGTNPDLLLLLDLPAKSTWHFAATGMTAEGVRLTFKEKVVYEIPHTAGQGNVFDTWCHFHPDK